MNKEVWKDIKNYNNLYQINNFGQVKNLKTNKIIKQIINKDGYYCCCLTKSKKHYTFITHRLIAQTFIPNPENKLTVNHKNGIKLDNNLKNLEWATIKENIQHAWATGLAKAKKGVDHYRTTLTEKEVLEIRKLYKIIPQVEIAKIYKVKPPCINDIVHNRNWKHI